MFRGEHCGAWLAAAVAVAGCGGQAGLGGDDQDGVTGGDVTFGVTVTDDAFEPSAIWKTQNLATVTLNLKNAGTAPHGFRIHCLGGACFPPGATVAPLAPGDSVTATFTVPYHEGIYEVDSGGGSAGPTGQFIVQ